MPLRPLVLLLAGLVWKRSEYPRLMLRHYAGVAIFVIFALIAGTVALIILACGGIVLLRDFGLALPLASGIVGAILFLAALGCGWLAYRNLFVISRYPDTEDLHPRAWIEAFCEGWDRYPEKKGGDVSKPGP